MRLDHLYPLYLNDIIDYQNINVPILEYLSEYIDILGGVDSKLFNEFRRLFFK